MSESPLPPGAVECSPEEAARYGVGPDEPPPPMPWADVFAAAVVDVDAAGIPRCAAQLADDLLSGELSDPDLAGVRRVLGSFRLDGHHVDPGIVALMVRVARGELTTEQAIAETHARTARDEFGDPAQQNR